MLVLANPYFGRVQFSLKLRSNFSYNDDNNYNNNDNNNNNNNNKVMMMIIIIIKILMKIMMSMIIHLNAHYLSEIISTFCSSEFPEYALLICNVG